MCNLHRCISCILATAGRTIIILAPLITLCVPLRHYLFPPYNPPSRVGMHDGRGSVSNGGVECVRRTTVIVLHNSTLARTLHAAYAYKASSTENVLVFNALGREQAYKSALKISSFEGSKDISSFESRSVNNPRSKDTNLPLSSSQMYGRVSFRILDILGSGRKLRVSSMRNRISHSGAHPRNLISLRDGQVSG